MSAPAALDVALLRRRFDRAAPSFANAAVVQREVGNRLLERFDVMRVSPATILDIGCGPGTHTAALSARFPDAMVTAVDHSPAMVARAVLVFTALQHSTVAKFMRGLQSAESPCMANARNRGQKADTGRDAGGFVALPWSVMDCAAYARLSHPAKALLFELAR